LRRSIDQFLLEKISLFVLEHQGKVGKEKVKEKKQQERLDVEDEEKEKRIGFQEGKEISDKSP
jgi:hypothetical protein